MLVTAEAVKGESRQSGQVQEAVRDILFRIETELVSRRRVYIGRVEELCKPSRPTIWY
jgi:hypothetical protein